MRRMMTPKIRQRRLSPQIPILAACGTAVACLLAGCATEEDSRLLLGTLIGGAYPGNPSAQIVGGALVANANARSQGMAAAPQTSDVAPQAAAQGQPLATYPKVTCWRTGAGAFAAVTGSLVVWNDRFEVRGDGSAVIPFATVQSIEYTSSFWEGPRVCINTTGGEYKLCLPRENNEQVAGALRQFVAEAAARSESKASQPPNSSSGHNAGGFNVNDLDDNSDLKKMIKTAEAEGLYVALAVDTDNDGTFVVGKDRLFQMDTYKSKDNLFLVTKRLGQSPCRLAVRDLEDGLIVLNGAEEISKQPANSYELKFEAMPLKLLEREYDNPTGVKKFAIEIGTNNPGFFELGKSGVEIDGVNVKRVQEYENGRLVAELVNGTKVNTTVDAILEKSGGGKPLIQEAVPYGRKEISVDFGHEE